MIGTFSANGAVNNDMCLCPVSERDKVLTGSQNLPAEEIMLAAQNLEDYKQTHDTLRWSSLGRLVGFLPSGCCGHWPARTCMYLVQVKALASRPLDAMVGRLAVLSLSSSSSSSSSQSVSAGKTTMDL